MWKRKTFLVCLLVLGMFIMAIPAPAIAADDIWVTTANVNLRSQPDPTSPILFTIAQDSVVWRLGPYQNNFYQVQAWNPSTSQWNQGWVSISYVTTSLSAANQSGAVKTVYYKSGSSWVSSVYTVPSDAVIHNEDYSGSWIPLVSYSLSEADYTYFSHYVSGGNEYGNPQFDGHVYGRYRVSGPAYYWFAH